jgi:hypothetical protein
MTRWTSLLGRDLQQCQRRLVHPVPGGKHQPCGLSDLLVHARFCSVRIW